MEGGEAGASSGPGARPRGQKGAPGRAMRDDGFNLLLPYSTSDEELVMGGDVLEAGGGGPAAPGSSGRAEELLHATRLLRARLCMARCRPLQRQFTGDGLALLQRYVVSVRQSGVGAHVPHAQIVATLVALARGCALLLGNAVVRTHPECVVAILLVEMSLCTRFGDAYYNACMPRMQLSPEVPLEEQLFSLYQILDLQLKDVAPTVSSVPGDWPSTVSG